MSLNKNNKKRIKTILEEGPKTTGEIMQRLKEDPTTRGTQRILKGGKIIGYKKKKRESRRNDTPTMNQLSNLMRSVATKTGFCRDNKQAIWELKAE